MPDNLRPFLETAYPIGKLTGVVTKEYWLENWMTKYLPFEGFDNLQAREI